MLLDAVEMQLAIFWFWFSIYPCPHYEWIVLVYLWFSSCNEALYMKVIALLKKEKSAWAYGWGGKSYARPFASSSTWVKLFVTFLLAYQKCRRGIFFPLSWVQFPKDSKISSAASCRSSLYQIVSPHQSISVCLSRVYLVCNQIFNTKLWWVSKLMEEGMEEEAL